MRGSKYLGVGEEGIVSGDLSGGRLLLHRYVGRSFRRCNACASVDSFFRFFTTSRILGGCGLDSRRVRGKVMNNKGSNNYSNVCVFLGSRVIGRSRLRALSTPGNTALRLYVVRTGGRANFGRNSVVG